MASLFDLGVGEFDEFKRVIHKAGFSAELIRRVNGDPRLAAKMRETLEAPEVNAFILSVDEQLSRFKAASEAGGWGFGDEVFEKLAQSAPEWPEGALCVRSLRIRIGEGTPGVQKTFEAHASEIRRVFTSAKFWRWEHLRSAPSPYTGNDAKLQKRFGSDPVERLRLLAGNDSHKPVVEWVVLDLDAHRKRPSIERVRSKKSSPADEMLVVAWMFPEIVRAIDYDEVPGMFAAGYEINVPAEDEVDWQDVPYVSFDSGRERVLLSADWHSNGSSNYSVPALRE
ncbi:hypothetical protein EPO33_03495 [Patescibacteria group bacterium]|nr:MAG: hypothetical protein EPO33_03495 [Patescibacteria group bacterium]